MASVCPLARSTAAITIASQVSAAQAVIGHALILVTLTAGRIHAGADTTAEAVTAASQMVRRTAGTAPHVRLAESARAMGNVAFLPTPSIAEATVAMRVRNVEAAINAFIAILSTAEAGSHARRGIFASAAALNA